MLRKNPLWAAAVLMMAAEAAASTGSTATAAPVNAAPTGDVPSSNDANTAAPAKKARAPKNPENKLDIVNGRLPLPLVFMIRFSKIGTLSNADAAKAFGTSVGKVFDIMKGRNFGYVDASYKPSAEEVTAAKAWCTTAKTAKGKSLAEAGGRPDDILKALEAMGTASQEEVAKRNWNIREVGKAAATGQAPTAPTGGAAAAPAASGAAPAEKPAGAKLF